MESTAQLSSAHLTFPLTYLLLSRLSLTPEFDYPDIYNARQLNARLGHSQSSLTPAEISAVGLIGKVFLKVIDLYQQSSSPSVFINLDGFLSTNQTTPSVNKALRQVIKHYPTTPSYYSTKAINQYLFSKHSSSNQRHAFYKSLILIFLAEENQAIRRTDGIFTDPVLFREKNYRSLQKLIRSYFSTLPAVQSAGVSLLDFLSEPAKASPNSLDGQINYIIQHWSPLLGEAYLQELLRALDHLKEERHPVFLGPGQAGNPLGYTLASYLTDKDFVRFSADQDWMPSLVLIAKNVFVWLDQLSRQYQQPIHKLNQIPDEELGRLSSWGITGLWLIGLWERSSASQKIKQLGGNPDAVPSAYSLYDYSIAESLGGDSAYQDLVDRAAFFKIRLAADMVPNHMGIYSKWVVEHPDWFINLDYPPFPSYTFSGPNLSEDPRVSVFLEDQYYDKSDAAVVFKRVDNLSGKTLYIYHGNDGTAMPWNDTAQLNFLQKETRQAVIDTILHVARKFPIIRFDAAMTLTKKHYQRLWFPEPGSGGAIPTRSDFGLSKQAFNAAMPDEFWREVVDAVAREAPDTLLLAEAFWMMEGYFVRTLGMHRVYNSAFMHMLRDEDNKKYRDLIIQTLLFDPQILKRYVNFMNNPDEETAITQFGSGGKYFGICILMATLPGLPMFGHGQIEGYSEKYGMEYYRAYYQEEPDYELIARHQREIFPLLHKRYLFAEIDHFVLYDLVASDGKINEDVFVFSNRSGKESALIVYHNRWGSAQGQINLSTPSNSQSISLLTGLGFAGSNADFVLFKEHISGLEFIRSVKELSADGIRIDLGAYQYQVFLNFIEVFDENGKYSRLANYLGGKGTPNLLETISEIKLAPLLSALQNLYFSWGLNSFSSNLNNADSKLPSLIVSIQKTIEELFPSPIEPVVDYAQLVSERLAALHKNPFPLDPQKRDLLHISIFYWILFRDYMDLIPEKDNRILLRLFCTHPESFSIDPNDNFESLSANIDLLAILDSELNKFNLSADKLAQFWFSNQLITRYLRVHDYEGVSWFTKESFDNLLDLTLSYLFCWGLEPEATSKKSGDNLLPPLLKLQKLYQDCLEESEYKVSNFINAIHNSPTAA